MQNNDRLPILQIACHHRLYLLPSKVTVSIRLPGYENIRSLTEISTLKRFLVDWLWMIHLISIIQQRETLHVGTYILLQQNYTV